MIFSLAPTYCEYVSRILRSPGSVALTKACTPCKSPDGAKGFSVRLRRGFGVTFRAKFFEKCHT